MMRNSAVRIPDTIRPGQELEPRLAIPNGTFDMAGLRTVNPQIQYLIIFGSLAVLYMLLR